MPPFLDAATFANWAKKPEWASSQLATSVLTVVSDWIRDNKPGIGAEDQGAKVVTFEVAQTTMAFAELGPYESVEKKTAHSSRAVTVDRELVERFITDRHRQMLGLATFAKPAYYFGD
ncbi:hypothetical protein A5742_12535 [Mycolicibacterium fortuitum]|uniref:Head-to-tail adaptor n=1 Tax=Mycolicibacterium fortuitum TaxID=1766 RepID=A0ABD6QDM1_MYCFO|nr:hypothetical protein [Mycolicibacterium fortuitum]OMC35490.1 hypothetical protein A5742_12535 [Mycolicibacterium fortuitum]